MKAVIHIGTCKTGTTTIQRCLAKNRNALRAQNTVLTSSQWGMAKNTGLQTATCIPEIRQSLYYKPTANLIIRYGILTQITPKVQLREEKQLRRSIEKCGKDDTVIFSDEMLSSFTQEETSKCKKLIDDYFDDVTVVLYLRRQPEYLVSYYYTLVTNGSAMSFADYLNMPEEQSFLAYHNMVKNWQVFGKDNVKVRIFDKKEFHQNDLVADFAHAIGMDASGWQRVKDENVSSLDSASIEFLRLLNAQYPKMEGPGKKNIDRSVLKRVFLQALQANEKAYHLTQSETAGILGRFHPGNSWIAQEYFGRPALFSDDVSMYPEEVVSPHNLTLERSAEITARLWQTSGHFSFMMERWIRNLIQF